RVLRRFRRRRWLLRWSGRGAPPPRGRRRGVSTWARPSQMTMILVMSDVVLPLAEIKKRLSEIVDGVQARHDRVVLTRNGRPAAVLISPDELESLEETLEILSDPSAMRAIRKAEKDIDAGKGLSADDLRAKYLKR